MSHFNGFNGATRRAFASYLGSPIARDFVIVYLIVIGALAFSIRDTRASASPEAPVLATLDAA